MTDYTASQQSAISAIISKARQLGVDARTALASASVETGGSYNAMAVGDNGTSFGLFQLHRGGELGTLSPQAAFDPSTNAGVALSVFAANQGRYSDPGALAAASQRPADPSGYAAKVDALYNDPSFFPTLPGAPPGAAAVGLPSISGAAGAVTSSVSQWISTWLVRSALIVAGAAILLVAAHSLSSSSDNVAGTAVEGTNRTGSTVRAVRGRWSGASSSDAPVGP